MRHPQRWFLRFSSLAFSACLATAGSQLRLLPGHGSVSFGSTVESARSLGDRPLIAAVESLGARRVPESQLPALDELLSCAAFRIGSASFRQAVERGERPFVSRPRPGADSTTQGAWWAETVECSKHCLTAAELATTPGDRDLAKQFQAVCQIEEPRALAAMHEVRLTPVFETLARLERNPPGRPAALLSDLSSVSAALHWVTGESPRAVEARERLACLRERHSVVVAANEAFSRDPEFKRLLQRDRLLIERFSHLTTNSTHGDRVPRSPEAAVLLEGLQAERSQVQQQLTALRRSYGLD